MQNQENRRKVEPAAVEQLIQGLSAAQCLTLRNIESFGWELRFVRQSAVPVPVVFGPDGKTIGVLEADGRLNINVEITVRERQSD